MFGNFETQLANNVLNRIEVQRIGVDDYSAVRYVHASALRLKRESPFVEREIAAFCKLVYSPRYLDALRSQDLYAAWLDGEMVATAGWAPSGNSGNVARVSSVYVRPLFEGIGIGRKLLTFAERRALKAGFTNISLRATIHSVGFFEHLGYSVTSHGVRGLPNDQDLPVAFMRKCLARERPRASTPAAPLVKPQLPHQPVPPRSPIRTPAF